VRGLRLIAGAAVVAVAAVLAVSVRAEPSPLPLDAPDRLRTGVYAGPVDLGSDADGTGTPAAFANIRKTGATFVRLSLYWPAIVGAEPRTGFNGANPDDTDYSWGVLDQLVKRAVARHLEPIVSFWGVPTWARTKGSTPPGGNAGPQLAALKALATAAATRYSGTKPGLPRVRYWMVWNEPNFAFYLSPVFDKGKLVSPGLYRAMVNVFADAVHGVRPDNRVIAGGLEPFTQEQPRAIGPLRFMRSLLCLPHNETGCRAKTKFDIWSTHPYTSGGPTHTAHNADDVSLGDLPEMRALLQQAWRLHRIAAPREPEFWVTEFSWDSYPPDPGGVPMRLEVRWVAEALYRMWASGVSLVVWLQIHDDQNYPGDDLHSGLYFNGPGGIATDRPKPILNAFRFPFVAFRGPGGTTYWGRTPRSTPAIVTVELKVGTSRWRPIAVIRANRNGVFKGVARRTAKTGYVRARIGNDSSPSFSLVVPPDRPATPFGTGPRR
jgi:hypothetical protein